MKQKKMGVLLSVAIVIVVAVLSWWVITSRSNDEEPPKHQNSNTNQDPQTRKQICPDAWYDNRMPGPPEENGKSSQYFIINGQRVELNELDVEWVKANCIVNEPHVVY